MTSSADLFGLGYHHQPITDSYLAVADDLKNSDL